MSKNNIKYLDVTLSRQEEDVYVKNFNTWKIETEEDITRCNELPCSWIGRIYIVKMTIISKAIYRLNTTFTKYPTQFFRDLDMIIQNLILKIRTK